MESNRCAIALDTGLGCATGALRLKWRQRATSRTLCSGPTCDAKAGLGMAAGTALTSVGIGIDNSGLVYAGIPTFVVGAGLLVTGFLIDGRIYVGDSMFAHWTF